MSEPSIARLLEVARRHKPRGWTCIADGVHPLDRDGLKTIAYVRWCTKELHHPEIVDRHSLYTYLHECGHVHMGHEHDDDDFCAAQTEYEAEIYAIKAMRAAGIAVPRMAVIAGRDYVRRIIEGVYEDVLPQDSGYHIKDASFSEEALRWAYGADWRKTWPAPLRLDKARGRR